MAIVDVLLPRLVSEVGVIGIFVLWVLYQVYSPVWLPETKFQKAVNGIKVEIRETKKMLVSTITVLRAVVRTNDEVATDKVDEYLVENGVEPDDFIRDAHTARERDKRQQAGDD